MELEAEVRRLELQIKELKGQLHGRSSERMALKDGQGFLFSDPIQLDQAKRSDALLKELLKPASQKTGAPKGPKPIDPNLPRELFSVPCPPLEDLICPVSGKLMQPGFIETIEVLSRRPAVWFVKRIERTVYVSPAKGAPVYSEWPADVLPRSKVDATVIAYTAAQHFCEHQPYARTEAHLERLGVSLPRVNQVSLMEQLDERVLPLYKALFKEILSNGYLHLDATPVMLCDPARPGATRESTLWAYSTHDGVVGFIFELSKSPTHPAKVLLDADYKGLLQTDGASGFDKLGNDKNVVRLGCLAHCRRYFYKAVQAGERQAVHYLQEINRIFRADRLSRHFQLSEANHRRLRMETSLPRFLGLINKALLETVNTPPKTKTGEAFHYLLAQRASLERCISVPGACLDNNAAERSIRPLKMGANNWLHIGHPDAGPRLARLFSLIENCRLEGVDPEAYLADIITRLPDYPNARIAELLPRQWALARALKTPVSA